MAPPGGWRKRHQQAARRHGNEVRAQGRRALYNDTVRWWAHRNKISFQQAASDPNFQALWEARRGDDRDERLKALDEMGILTQDRDGNWKYSNAFMAWLFEEQ